MANHKVGRNEPCPCGSGKKYKKCCLGKDIEPLPNRAREFNEEVARVMAGREFASLEEAQELLDRLTELRNTTALDDFQGLSPEQMTKLLYSPFDSPDVLSFAEVLGREPSAPILTLVGLIIEAVGEEGLKATAKGNLPRTFCRQAAERFWGREEYLKRTELGDVLKEADFPELQVARITAEQAGLLKRRSGRFRLTRKCLRALAANGNCGIYPMLLRAYVAEFNWAYRDYYPGLELIQQSFAFTLYLLAKHGSTVRSNGDYESWFQRAFPQLLHDVDASHSYRSAEELVSDCYTLRALVRFADFLGLARVQPVSDSLAEREFLVQKLPLLDDAVRFADPKRSVARAKA